MNRSFNQTKDTLISNGGFILLAMIIEKITQTLYRDFMHQNILSKINMKDSGFYAFNDLPENTANGYMKDRSISNIYNLPIRGAGDGGMYTTTNDLKIFWNNLFSYKIISKQLTEEYLKNHYIFNNTIGYGCGIYKRLDNSMFYIVGCDAGVGFDSRYIPSDNLIVNILSNVTNGEKEIRSLILQYLTNDI